MITGDKLTTFVFGLPALLGGIGVIGVIWYELAQPQGIVSYYGEKLADGITAMCLVGLALFLADALARLAPQLRGSRSRVAMVALAAVVVVCVGWVVGAGVLEPPQADAITPSTQTVAAARTDREWKGVPLPFWQTPGHNFGHDRALSALRGFGLRGT